MGAIIIDGKLAAAEIREEARQRTGFLKEKGNTPCLAVILVGEDPASLSYVRAKQKALAEVGMDSKDLRLSGDTGEAALLSLIASLNADESVHGILVQLPLPAHIREEAVIAAIDPCKDVDCFHPVNVGRLLLGEPGFLPCTPGGIAHLLKAQKIPTEGAHAVVVGRSNIVGKPLAL
ncbi:MAG: bifunctional 5,10-methylene-tetrahydrofolate dehydrogenase/5,10-methylene-tetrahydrofolate cyclohydrolase, partial [Treponema sp.]|nr:bifunctional 5,10-methylene-tetrahydrofolate dehydrogenase/5,10-methylene-tetrahydrofolate cyclohydrolase [Treponema sp.]